MKVTEEQAKKTLKKAKSKTEWAKLLGFRYLNGKVSKVLDDLCLEYNLDMSHFDTRHKLRKWALIEKQCPVCNKIFKTQKDHPKEKTVCSHSCSNSYFSNIRHTKQANAKTSKSITNYLINSGKYVRKNVDSLPKKIKKRYSAYCKMCDMEFFPKKKKYKYCSIKCSRAVFSSKEYKEKLRQIQLKLIAEGKHKGWISRDKCNRSYAEKYVEDLLTKNGLCKDKDYKTEYKQDKWFIDFAFLKEQIAIEIDGSQHNWPERQIKDQEKDKTLKELGWKVFRIKWKRPSKQTRQRILKELNNILPYKIKDDTI